jgi:hypothetical protein
MEEMLIVSMESFPGGQKGLEIEVWGGGNYFFSARAFQDVKASLHNQLHIPGKAESWDIWLILFLRKFVLGAI